MLNAQRPVVYADDNSDDRYLMQEAWREAGISHALKTVADGAEAIRLLEQASASPPGLILLDIKMPRMTGFETLERIRASPEWRRIPVIIFSASLFPGDVARSYELGAAGFVCKPSSLEELVELIGGLKTFWLKFCEFPPLK